MPTNPTDDFPLDELKLRELSRRAKLMELAKGNKVFSWAEAGSLLLIAVTTVPGMTELR